MLDPADVSTWVQEQIDKDPKFAVNVSRESRMRAIGHQIQCRRKERGISLADFSFRVGITRYALTQIERGEYDKITIAMMRQIAINLGLELCYDLELALRYPNKA